MALSFTKNPEYAEDRDAYASWLKGRLKGGKRLEDLEQHHLVGPGVIHQYVGRPIYTHEVSQIETCPVCKVERG